MNSEDEAAHRLSLCEFHLKGAREEMEDYLKSGDRDHLAHCVSEAQLSIENAAKALLFCSRIPSKSHDVSSELKRMVEELSQVIPPNILEGTKMLGVWVKETAPEHWRADYGDEAAHLLPGQLYDEPKTRDILNKAEEAFSLAKEFISFWFKK